MLENVRLNAVCTALIYGLVHVHSDTVFNYIIICLIQCTKWTVRRKEGLQVGLLSWNPGDLRLRIITCYCTNSVFIHSPRRPSLGHRGHLHMAFPNIYLAQDIFLGGGIGPSYIYYGKVQYTNQVCSSYFYLLYIVRQDYKVSILLSNLPFHFFLVSSLTT